MTNVVPFPPPAPAEPPEPRIWVCACGCSSFELFDDGGVCCALCLKPQSESGGWTPPNTNKSWDGDVVTTEVGGNGSAAFAKRFLCERVNDADTVLAIVLKSDGAISSWSDLNTAEEWKQAHAAIDASTILRVPSGREPV